LAVITDIAGELAKKAWGGSRVSIPNLFIVIQFVYSTYLQKVSSASPRQNQLHRFVLSQPQLTKHPVLARGEQRVVMSARRLFDVGQAKYQSGLGKVRIESDAGT